MPRFQVSAKIGSGDAYSPNSDTRSRFRTPLTNETKVAICDWVFRHLGSLDRMTRVMGDSLALECGVDRKKALKALDNARNLVFTAEQEVALQTFILRFKKDMMREEQTTELSEEAAHLCALKISQNQLADGKLLIVREREIKDRWDAVSGLVRPNVLLHRFSVKQQYRALPLFLFNAGEKSDVLECCDSDPICGSVPAIPNCGLSSMHDAWMSPLYSVLEKGDSEDCSSLEEPGEPTPMDLFCEYPSEPNSPLVSAYSKGDPCVSLMPGSPLSSSGFEGLLGYQEAAIEVMNNNAYVANVIPVDCKTLDDLEYWSAASDRALPFYDNGCN